MYPASGYSKLSAACSLRHNNSPIVWWGYLKRWKCEWRKKKNTTACQIDFEKNVSVTAVNCNKNPEEGGGSLISL